MDKQHLTINGKICDFEEGETILEVASRNGIMIPTLCYLKGASPTGACRICVVEVKGARNLVASCAAPAGKDMVVYTESPRVVKSRRLTLELLLASGYHNCLVQDMDPGAWTDFQLKGLERDEHKDICPAYGECRLQAFAIKYGVRTGRFQSKETPHPYEKANPFILRDFSRCILCGRCVQACNEIQCNNAISHGYRGSKSKIVAMGDRALKDSDCVFCGQCVESCPVGALVEEKALRTGLAPKAKKVRTTCPYCGVGCQMWLHMVDGRISKVTAVENGSPNKGRLCVKGRFGYDFVYSEERLKTPLIREGAEFRSATWDEALDLVAERFKGIIEKHGPDALAGVSCARSINEDSYQMQKLFRAVFGTNNIDHCART
jgi:NADP-reducing hydrogenase subunit HndD